MKKNNLKIQDKFLQVKKIIHSSNIAWKNFEAEKIVKYVTKENFFYKNISYHHSKKINNILYDRVVYKKPLSSITGKKYFWKGIFICNENVLHPRQDSEHIIEQACLSKKNFKRILDIGSGSGCLAISLAVEFPLSTVIGVDICKKSIKIAKKNAILNKVKCTFIHSNYCEKIKGKFDLIVSNPPYISSRKMSLLPPEILLHEPYLALHGGDDGLHAYRHIFLQTCKILHESGILIVECDRNQENQVCEIAKKYFNKCSFYNDYSGCRGCIITSPRNIYK